MAKDSWQNTLLSENVTVLDYLRMEKDQDKNQIISFIKARFGERYMAL